jgi:hypothetical protein
VSHDGREAFSSSLRAARFREVADSRIVSAQTDWILFDNSAAIDFVAQFLQPGTPRFLELIDSLRLDLVRAMLAEGRSVVFTFVYFGFNREDISFFKFLAAAATPVGASLASSSVEMFRGNSAEAGFRFKLASVLGSNCAADVCADFKRQPAREIAAGFQ